MRQSQIMRLMQPEDFFWELAYPFEAQRRESEKGFSRYFYETEEAYVHAMDIPGVKAEEINIELEEGRLQISAERKIGPEKDQIKKYFFEFRLPKNIDKEKIDAHYENGVLTLAVKKVVEEKTKKKIQVQTGAKSGGWNFLNFGKASKEQEEVQVVN